MISVIFPMCLIPLHDFLMCHRMFADWKVDRLSSVSQEGFACEH